MIKKLYKYTSILVIILFSLSIISCKTLVTKGEETALQTVSENVEESSIDGKKSLVASDTLIETEPIKLNKEDVVETESQSIEVDKGILSVEITLPASFFEGDSIGSIANYANKDNDIKVTKNSDGSVTYKMSKSKHNELMKELNENLIQQIELIKNDGDYKSIEDITHNKTFSEFTFVVDQEVFENSFDGLATLSLGTVSLYYQLFNGINQEDYKVTIYFKNMATGEIFKSFIFPEDFKN